MKVSINQALKNVTSEKYNKQNIFLLFIIILTTGILSLFIPAEIQNPELARKLIPGEYVALLTEPKTMTILFLSFFLSLFLCGYNITATNNAIHEREEICPNPFTNIGNIFINGLSSFVGCLLVYCLIVILTLIPTILLTIISPTFIILIFFLVLVMVHAWLCVFFKFCMTLEFKEWFSFKSSWIMIANNARRYGSYIGKGILLSITYFALCFLAGLLIGLVQGMIGASSLAETSTNVLLAIVGSIFTCLFYVYSIDLTAQLLAPIVKKEAEETVQE